MNALGWQIGAILFGGSFFVIAVYIAKILNTANKTVEMFRQTIDYNKREIDEIIKSATNITKDTEEIISKFNNLIGFLNIFNFLGDKVKIKSKKKVKTKNKIKK
ncbi:MAG: DUF948 domain-containing protein [Clostridioides sp.]|jgi:uncharacterized protein YoxC|nr:DUF948 domain-containing protein [Clostridioides sp.]